MNHFGIRDNSTSVVVVVLGTDRDDCRFYTLEMCTK